jgi:hypothetical protein
MLELTVAERTVARIANLNRSYLYKFDELISTLPAEAGIQGERTVPEGIGGTQAEIHQLLLDIIQQPGGGPRCCIVTGDAGVGKSTVLRTVARDLCLDYLKRPWENPPIAILMPLQLFILRRDDIDEVSSNPGGMGLWLRIAQHWCGVANDARSPDLMSVPWLVEKLKGRAIALILDSLDEFLTNNGEVGMSAFRELLRELSRSYGGNHRLTVLVGVRSSQPGLESLATDSNHLFEVLRMTLSQAVRFFPEAAAAMDGLESRDLQRLLLTPLILAQLGPRVREFRNRPPQTKSDLMGLALKAVIERSGLLELHEADAWVAALSVVAWIYYSQYRAMMTVEEVHREAVAFRERWQAHLRGRRDEATTGIVAGLDIVANPQTCERLMRRTLFVPTGYRVFRLVHREWEDFLVADYLAYCLIHENVDELGYRGNIVPISRYTVEHLRGHEISEDLTRLVFRRTRETGRRFIFGNFSAIVASPRASLSGPTIRLLLSDEIADADPVARHVLLSGLSYRALTNALSDTSASDIRSQLILTLPAYAGAAGTHTDAVTASMAWCYLKAFSSRFATPGPENPWPGLGLEPGHQQDALGMVCSVTPSGLTVDPQNRSLQVAWLQVQDSVLTDPHRPISVTHYLYMLAVARHRNVHIAEAAEKLQSILEPGSRFARIIEDYILVPELWVIFQACRTLAFRSN